MDVNFHFLQRGSHRGAGRAVEVVAEDEILACVGKAHGRAGLHVFVTVICCIRFFNCSINKIETVCVRVPNYFVADLDSGSNCECVA